ncbi:MAG: hypothetical protein LBG88_02735 [Christensenellaceae bacterium]|jgi:hypothetical protein|nr:hypothetical protein [Christensenellaceae bacterium]
MKTKRKSLKDMGPSEKSLYYRKNASGFSIGVGVITLIAAPLLPLILGVPYKDAFIDIAISCALGVAFLILGILFLKKDSELLAKIMIGFFALYVVEKVYQIIVSYNMSVIIWLVFAIMQITYLVQYLRIRKIVKESEPVKTETIN